MTWTVVEGTYREGQIYLKEKIQYGEIFNVLVLIPDQTKRVAQSQSWEQLRQQIAAEIPNLLIMNEQERYLEFDQITTQIVQKMPYHSLEEFEQAMRGDQYDLARY